MSKIEIVGSINYLDFWWGESTRQRYCHHVYTNFPTLRNQSSGTPRAKSSIVERLCKRIASVRNYKGFERMVKRKMFPAVGWLRSMVVDREWFLELTSQLHKMRAIATGGVLKEHLRELEDEPEDLIGEGNDEVGEEYGRLLFGWKRQDKRYKLIDQYVVRQCIIKL